MTLSDKIKWNSLSEISRRSVRLCLLLFASVAASGAPGCSSNPPLPGESGAQSVQASTEEFADATSGGSASSAAERIKDGGVDAGPQEADKTSTAGDVYATLIWEAPGTNTDGSRLTDLAGYNVYYRRPPADYDKEHMFPLPLKSLSCKTNKGSGKVAKTTECTYRIRGLTGGPYYFVVRAYNKAGVESDPSNEVKK